MKLLDTALKDKAVMTDTKVSVEDAGDNDKYIEISTQVGGS